MPRELNPPDYTYNVTCPDCLSLMDIRQWHTHSSELCVEQINISELSGINNNDVGTITTGTIDGSTSSFFRYEGSTSGRIANKVNVKIESFNDKDYGV